MNIGHTFRQGTGALLACISFAAGSAPAQSGEQIAKQGSAGGAPACVSCHGATGQGQAAAGFPRLAALNAGYLVKQLDSFDGPTRTSPIMTPVAKLLSVADRQAVAGYYASLATADEGSRPVAVSPALAAGETLAQRGDWSKGVPACAQCHGPNGLGVGVAFPQIAGQPAAYIANQLRAWQQGTRQNDPLGLMRGVSIKLTEADMGNVAAYYASLSATPVISRRAKP